MEVIDALDWFTAPTCTLAFIKISHASQDYELSPSFVKGIEVSPDKVKIKVALKNSIANFYSSLTKFGKTAPTEVVIGTMDNGDWITQFVFNCVWKGFHLDVFDETKTVTFEYSIMSAHIIDNKDSDTNVYVLKED